MAADLVAAVAELPEVDQHSVLNFARFLRHQNEEERLAAEDEAWEKSFNDPERLKNFHAWMQKSLEGGVTPFDYSKL